jgi:hypothetical protein
MPFEYCISPEERIVYVTGYGDKFVDERIMQEIARDPDFDPNMNVLCDFTKFKESPFPGDMGRIAQVYRKYQGRIKGIVALVVPPSALDNGHILSHLVGSLGVRIEFFSDVESAKRFFNTNRNRVK